ncbi:MAG: glycosyltransferase family 4 protein [Burkholderiales bacterium]|nr:glycosyltransferase family 4 protein [Burkholderiales bacterium]
MHIVVNTRLMMKDRLDGIGWFSYETLRRITAAHPEHLFTFVFDRPAADEFVFSDNVRHVVLPPRAGRPLLTRFWFDVSLYAFLWRARPDLLISPDGALPIHSQVPALAVIHDINFAHRPADLPFLSRHYYNSMFPRYARKAARIATVSAYSKADIAETYGIPAEKIDVVYNGCNTGYRPVSETTRREVKAKYTEGCDYFVFVGSLHPRKNINGLVQAFDRFKSASGSALKLLIVGANYWSDAASEAGFGRLQHKIDVIFTGRLAQQELFSVFASALAMTYVPYFEGFGIPLLEAMNCDVPVVTSNVTSMPEIAGDAAIFVDPNSVEAIAAAMQRLASDPQLRATLIAKGRIRTEQFSWDRSARLLWQSVEKVLASHC